MSKHKPILSFVSPFPPQKTGIADYLAQLLPALKPYYELVLVIDDKQGPISNFDFPGEVLTASTFLGRPELQSRVVYQIGNSPWHLYALDLLKKVPGCVVLHDFFLGNALGYAQWELHQPYALTHALLQSHGLQILDDLADHGIHYCIEHYPANLGPISHALAIGAHSQYIKRMADHFYGPITAPRFYSLAFPKELKPIPSLEERRTLLNLHQFPEDAFIVSSIGFGSPVKQHELIIQAWIHSDLAKLKTAFLVFVGEYFNAAYLKQLQWRIPPHLQERVRFTGFTDNPTYHQYLAITDLAIQLRAQSRGENSAAVMDCFAAGIPVIANNHGTVHELPEKTIWKIAHPSSPATLITTLEYLYRQPVLRQQLGNQARAYLAQEHSLDKTAQSYVAMIEKACMPVSLPSNPLLQPKGLVLKIQPPQLLLDITDTAKQDKRTGIQRVVRSLFHALLKMDTQQNPYRVRPIYLDEYGQYRHANQYMLKQFGVDCPGFEDEAVEVQAGDIYLDLDFNTITAVEQAQTYAQWRNQGLTVMHLVYDLLPLSNPEWFLPFMEGLYTTWLTSISTHSDGLLTISKNVANQLEAFLDKIPNSTSENGRCATRPQVAYFHLGSDLEASLPSKGMPSDAPKLLALIEQQTSFLMVSTLEPRKAYEQTLDAFEEMWAKDMRVNLIIVGKEGWHANALVDRITQHPQLDNQLFWLNDISDEYLESLYQKSSALLMASYGEGFGLPIVEAAKNGLPVIARKISVFQEVGGAHISYFDAQNGTQLAHYLQSWLNSDPKDKPDITQWQPMNWKESAERIIQVVRAISSRT